MFNEYPYVNLQDINLDWLLKTIKKLRTDLDDFVSINTIKYADPISWDITKQYEANTVVVDPYDGTAYISVRPVPIGVNIDNTEYWSAIFNYDAMIEDLKANIATNEEDNTTATNTYSEGALIWVNNDLYEALTDIPAGTAFIVDTNIGQITVETFVHNLLNDLSVYLTEYTDNAVESINDPVNVLTLGVKNDGSEPDGTTNADIINANIDKYLYFPDGTYAISKTIINDKATGLHLLFANNATLKATETLEYLIKNDPWTDNNDWTWGSFIKGGIIDGDNKVDTLVGLYANRFCTYANSIYKNFTNTAFNTNLGVTQKSASNLFFNLYIINESNLTGTTAFTNNGQDNVLIFVNTANTVRGFYTATGNKFYACHSWCYKELFDGSIAFEATGQNFFTDCTSDNMQTGFKMTGLNSINYLNNHRFSMTAAEHSQDYIDAFGGFKIFDNDASGERIIADNLFIQVDLINGTFIPDALYNAPIFFVNNKFTNVRGTSNADNLSNWIYGSVTDSRGNRFTSGADLDDFIFTGKWFSDNSTLTASLSNLPTGFSGAVALIVEYVANIRKQTCIKCNVNDPDDIYYRLGTTSTWSSWIRLTEEEYVDRSSELTSVHTSVTYSKFITKGKECELYMTAQPTGTGGINLCGIPSDYLPPIQLPIDVTYGTMNDIGFVTMSKIAGGNVSARIATTLTQAIYLHAKWCLV